MNLIEKIIKLQYNDDELTGDQSILLESYYKKATEDEKAQMDNVSICICGYGIGSILSNKEEIQTRLRLEE